MENKEKLPPKRGPLDKLITKSADIAKVLSGQKVAIHRNGGFADFGEKWSLEDTELIAKNVYSKNLAKLAMKTL